MFNILSQEAGKIQLGILINDICNMLNIVCDIGAFYSNLRTENILLKMSIDLTKIQGIKYLNFGHLTKVEDAEDLRMPD